MASDLYPYRTPGQALLQSVKVVTEAGYDLAGVVFDNQFAGKLHLAGLLAQHTPFVARARLNQKIEFEGQKLSIRELGQQYPPGKARYYKRFGWYVKRLKIKLDGVGELDLMVIWLPQQEGFKLIALFSTLKAGIQEVIATWKARWDLERVHRLLKQNLGLSKCLCRSYAAQLKHADLTLSALLHIRQQKQLFPDLSWRETQQKTAQILRSQLLTGLPSLSA